MRRSEGHGLKSEFSVYKLSLSHQKPRAFCEAQWQWPAPVFLVYRLVMAAYAVFAFVYLTVDSVGGLHNMMAYLTCWTYLVETLFFTSGAALACLFFFRPGIFEDGRIHNPAFQESGEKPGLAMKVQGGRVNDAEAEADASSGKESGEEEEVSTPWYVQLFWLLSNVTQVFCFIVTVVYFGALYRGGSFPSLVDFNVHGLSSVMVAIDIAVSARPFRLLHFIYPLLYGIAYICFSAIYWSQDHANNVLYPNVLDWNYPGTTAAVVSGLALVGVPIVALCHFGLYKLRLFLYEKIYGRKYD